MNVVAGIGARIQDEALDRLAVADPADTPRALIVWACGVILVNRPDRFTSVPTAASIAGGLHGRTVNRGTRRTVLSEPSGWSLTDLLVTPGGGCRDVTVAAGTWDEIAELLDADRIGADLPAAACAHTEAVAENSAYFAWEASSSSPRTRFDESMRAELEERDKERVELYHHGTDLVGTVWDRCRPVLLARESSAGGGGAATRLYARPGTAVVEQLALFT